MRACVRELYLLATSDDSADFKDDLGVVYGGRNERYKTLSGIGGIR